MKDYTENKPVFSDTIQITETSDPAHADNINAAPMQLLQNTLHNRNEIDELKKGNNEVELEEETGQNIPGGDGEDPGEAPDPGDAIEQITSGKSVPTLIGHIKTALKGLLSLSESIIGKISGLTGMIAGVYSVDKAYDAGEYCTHDEHMYKFTSSKATGVWDPDKVMEVTVAEELALQGATVQGIVESMGNPDVYDPNHLYHMGDFCIQDNKIYKRIADMATNTELPHEWDATEWTETSIIEMLSELNENLQNIETLLGGGLYMKNWRSEANEITFKHGEGITLSVEAPTDGFIFVYSVNIRADSLQAIPNIDVSADFESIIKTGFGLGAAGGGRFGRTEIIKINCEKGDIVSVTILPISQYPTETSGKISAVSIY